MVSPARFGPVAAYRDMVDIYLAHQEAWGPHAAAGWQWRVEQRQDGGQLRGLVVVFPNDGLPIGGRREGLAAPMRWAAQMERIVNCLVGLGALMDAEGS